MFTAIRSLAYLCGYRRKYKQVSKDYPLGPGTVLIVTRPCDHVPFQRLYPVHHYTFFRTQQGDFGFQFCDWLNRHCPDEFGPCIKDPKLVYAYTKNQSRWEFFLVTDDEEKKECILRTALATYKEYRYRSEIRAIMLNVYDRFVEDVIAKCEKEN